MTLALGSGALGWVSVAALAALGLLGAVAVAWPLLASGDADELAGREEAPEHVRAREDLSRSLTALREIAFDHACGNLSDEDFSRLDTTERATAVRLMRQIDAFDAKTGEAA